jgi:hypothetical protein
MLCRGQHVARELRVERPFRAELFLCFEVGGRQLVCPKLRYLFTKLNAITSYKKVVILWTVNCPMETFDDVCYEIGRFVG